VKLYADSSLFEISKNTIKKCWFLKTIILIGITYKGITYKGITYKGITYKGITYLDYVTLPDENIIIRPY